MKKKISFNQKEYDTNNFFANEEFAKLFILDVIEEIKNTKSSAFNPE